MCLLGLYRKVRLNKSDLPLGNFIVLKMLKNYELDPRYILKIKLPRALSLSHGLIVSLLDWIGRS